MKFGWIQTSGMQPTCFINHGGGPCLSELLGIAGVASATNDERGWDHGVFVPMKVMFPAAGIPVLQLNRFPAFALVDVH
jgi:aromatic ring-opening dioxygenase catalytic subunit (LigB family)